MPVFFYPPCNFVRILQSKSQGERDTQFSWKTNSICFLCKKMHLKEKIYRNIGFGNIKIKIMINFIFIISYNLIHFQYYSKGLLWRRQDLQCL